MYEKCYTPEQPEELRLRAERIGPERMQEVEAEWPALIEQVKFDTLRVIGIMPATRAVNNFAGVVQW